MLWLCLSMSPRPIFIYGDTKTDTCRIMAPQEVALTCFNKCTGQKFKWHNLHYPYNTIAQRDGCNPSVACSWVYRNMYKIVIRNSPTIVSNFVDGETAEPGETFCKSKILPALMSLLTCNLRHTWFLCRLKEGHVLSVYWSQGKNTYNWIIQIQIN